MTFKNAEDLKKRLEEVQRQNEEIRKDFIEYISNKEISLELRWKMFTDAPEWLSNYWDSTYYGLDFVVDGLWKYEYTHKETVYLMDFLDNVKNSIGKDYSPYKDPGIIDQIKEQMMKDNIKSFIFE